MPAKTIKIHTQDAPWITGHLKSLIQKRQKALSQDFIEIGLTEKGNAVSPYTIKRR